MENKENEMPQKTDEELGIRRVKLTSRRRATAKRLVETQHKIAQCTGSYKVDVTDLWDLRAKLVEKQELIGTKITITDMVSYAIVKALKSASLMNAYMTDSEIIYRDHVQLGVAAALEDGLVTVVVKNADELRLVELSQAVKVLLEKAKAKTLTMEDISGPTFLVSSMGPQSGDSAGTPLLAGDVSGIIQFGGAVRQPVVINEEIVIRSIMSVNMTYDHRIIDGMEVSAFNRNFKEYLQNPILLLL